MNHKQKLGYMGLGAGIMAVGIIIGQFFTPDIEAQNNGVFDEITCQRLKIVDEKGDGRIFLYALGPMASISIMNHMNNEEKEGIALTSFTPFNPDGPLGSENSNSITIFKPAGTKGIEFNAEGIVNNVMVHNAAGKLAILLGGAEDDSGITIYDKMEKRAVRLDTAEDGNGVVVYGRTEKEITHLSASKKYGNYIRHLS